jgi:hypothetical protein
LAKICYKTSTEILLLAGKVTGLETLAENTMYVFTPYEQNAGQVTTQSNLIECMQKLRAD